MRILLADRDPDTLDVTAYALRRDGHTVVTATSGPDALRRLPTDRPQLLLLDAELPPGGGAELCRQVRQRDGDLPVILLSARTDDDHVVAGFRAGADDFVAKPFSPRQLAARIQAVWRRRGGAGEPEPQREVDVNGMRLDVDAHEVYLAGPGGAGELERVVRLTPTEFRLLHILALNAGRVVASGRLVEHAWGYDATDVLLLKTHICHLRKKLGLPRGQPGDIAAVHGVGYRLTRADAAGTAQRARPIQPHPAARVEQAPGGAALAPAGAAA
jgi:DNA-binding response OmpR family regulator